MAEVQVNLSLIPTTTDISYNGTTVRTTNFTKHYECVVCNHEGPEGDFGFIGGKPHCNLYGCYEERLHDN